MLSKNKLYIISLKLQVETCFFYFFFCFQIKDSRLRFRFNLNSLRTEEKTLWLTHVPVDDGQWHTAKVSRHGSIAMLELDGGEGKKYNETFRFEGHQWMQVDKQEGVYAGGKAEYTGHRSFEVYADYQKSESIWDEKNTHARQGTKCLGNFEL